MLSNGCGCSVTKAAVDLRRRYIANQCLETGYARLRRSSQNRSRWRFSLSKASHSASVRHVCLGMRDPGELRSRHTWLSLSGVERADVGGAAAIIRSNIVIIITTPLGRLRISVNDTYAMLSFILPPRLFEMEGGHFLRCAHHIPS